MLQKMDNLYWQGKAWMQYKTHEFLHKEDGDVNIVSVVVLIAIAVILAALFRDKIQKLLDKLFETIGTQADKATGAT